MISTFFLYFGGLSLTLFVTYLLGFFSLQLAKVQIRKGYSLLFARLFSGSAFLVIITSIIASKFSTINLALLIILLAYYNFGSQSSERKLKAEEPGNQKKILGLVNLRDLVILIATGVVIFSANYWFTFQNTRIPSLYHDGLFYSRVSNFILKHGIETYNLNLIDPGLSSPVPYHYFELWLNASFSFILNHNNILILLLVTYSHLLVALAIGVMAVFESFGKVNLVGNILSVLLLFTSGIMVQAYANISFLSEAENLVLNPIFYQKLLPVYLFLTASILCVIHGNLKNALLIILCLPIISVATAPAVFGSLMVFGLYLILIDRNRKLGFRLLFSAFLVILFFAAFYFFPAKKDNSMSDTHSLDKVMLFSLQDLKTFINIIGGGGLQISILYFYFISILLFFFIWKHKSLILQNLRIIFLVGSIFCISLISWALLKDMVDSVQIFTNISIPLLNLIIISSIAFLYYQAGRLKPIFMILVWIGLILNVAYTFNKVQLKHSFSEGYIRKINRESDGLNPVGAFIKAKEDYNSIFSKNSNAFTLGDYLAIKNSDYNTVCINVFDIPVDSTSEMVGTEMNLIQNTPFYRFVERQKRNGQFRDIGQSQIEFLDQYNIEYVIATQRAVLPERIQERVRKVITDPLSGEKFYLLK